MPSKRKSGQMTIRTMDQLSPEERKIDHIKMHSKAVAISSTKRRFVKVTLPKLAFMEKDYEDDTR